MFVFIPSEIRQGEEIASYADEEGYCQILCDSNVANWRNSYCMPIVLSVTMATGSNRLAQKVCSFIGIFQYIIFL